MIGSWGKRRILDWLGASAVYYDSSPKEKAVANG